MAAAACLTAPPTHVLFGRSPRQEPEELPLGQIL